MRFGRQVAVIMILSLMLSVVAVPAENGYPVSSNITVWIDGLGVPVPDESMRPYINERDRTMISVRSVSDSLANRGCSVSWDNDALSVTLVCNGKTIQFYFQRRSDGTLAGLPVGWVNGVGFHLHAPPELTRDRSFLGLRDLGELLDVGVEYIAANPDEGFHTPVAALWFDQLDLVDERAYTSAVEYLDRYTFASVNDDGTVTYGVSIPENSVVLPASVRPQHVQQYLRSIVESNEVQVTYTQFAYADPDHRIEPAAQPVTTVASAATAQTLLAQRQLVAQQMVAKHGKGAKLATTAIPSSLRRYRDKEGTLIEVYPAGEKHYLIRTKAQDLASKFEFAAGLGALGTFLASPISKAWPVGSFAMGLVSLSGAGYSAWMSVRLRSYCLADSRPGAVVKYFFVRVPERIAGPMDRAARDRFGIEPNIGRILFTMPFDCEPWGGIEPLGG